MPSSPPQRPTPKAVQATDRVRRICMGLPSVVERPSHGEATWFVEGKKSFASMSDHHHDDRVSVVFAAAPGAQTTLIAQDPARFFRPPYVGGRGWVGAYLDVAAPDWDLLEHLLAGAWALVAPAKLRTIDT